MHFENIDDVIQQKLCWFQLITFKNLRKKMGSSDRVGHDIVPSNWVRCQAKKINEPVPASRHLLDQTLQRLEKRYQEITDFFSTTTRLDVSYCGEVCM